MSNTIWLMQSSDLDFHRLPADIQRLLLAAEALGWSDFWWHPDYGLLAEAPGASIEDDRQPLDWAAVEEAGK